MKHHLNQLGKFSLLNMKSVYVLNNDNRYTLYFNDYVSYVTVMQSLLFTAD
jgi:hypothetical protein